jgi:hypothetical protein
VQRRPVRLRAFLALSVAILACHTPGRTDHQDASSPAAISELEFRELLDRLAASWESQDTGAAVSLFTADAVYMQPPDVLGQSRSCSVMRFFSLLLPIWTPPARGNQRAMGRWVLTAIVSPASHGSAERAGP